MPAPLYNVLGPREMAALGLVSTPAAPLFVTKAVLWDGQARARPLAPRPPPFPLENLDNLYGVAPPHQTD